MDLVTSFNTLSEIQSQAVVLWNTATEYSIASLQNIFDNLCTFKTRGKIGTLNIILTFTVFFKYAFTSTFTNSPPSFILADMQRNEWRFHNPAHLIRTVKLKRVLINK